MPIIKRAPGGFDFFEDSGSLRGPDKGFGTLVVFSDVCSDSHDQFLVRRPAPPSGVVEIPACDRSGHAAGERSPPDRR